MIAIPTQAVIFVNKSGRLGHRFTSPQNSISLSYHKTSNAFFFSIYFKILFLQHQCRHDTYFFFFCSTLFHLIHSSHFCTVPSHFRQYSILSKIHLILYWFQLFRLIILWLIRINMDVLLDLKGFYNQHQYTTSLNSKSIRTTSIHY